MSVPKSPSPRYPLKGSPLYQIRSIRRLAEVLQWRRVPSALRAFSKEDNFSRFTDKTRPDKPRQIQAPRPLVKSLQARLANLLGRIELPDYLHSGRRGRSYLTNSDAHAGASGATVKVDISDFFQSVSQNRVERFFLVDLGWPRDLAEIGARLVCCDGHLATGSPASPILSYFVNRQLFDAVAERAARRGALFTLYMDDLAVTGAGVGHGDVRFLTRLLERGRLRVKRSKTRVYRARHPKEITGRILKDGRSRAPNKQHKKLHQSLITLQGDPTNAGLRASAVGRLQHVALLDDERRGDLKAKARVLAAAGRGQGGN